MDPLFITNYVTINVLDELSRTPGVGQANLFGKLNYSMRIWFDTNRLVSLNLTPGDIIAAINAQNVQAPVGRIGARPIGDDQQFQFNVQTHGPADHARSSSARSCMRANPDGSVLRMRDVARIELGAQNMDSEARLNGKPAVPIGIYLAPGRQRGAGGDRGGADAGQTALAVSGRAACHGDVRLQHVRQRHDPRGDPDAGRRVRPGGDRGLPVPGQCARHASSRPSRCRSA